MITHCLGHPLDGVAIAMKRVEADRQCGWKPVSRSPSTHKAKTAVNSSVQGAFSVLGSGSDLCLDAYFYLLVTYEYSSCFNNLLYKTLLHYVRIFFLWANHPPLESETAIYIGREGLIERQLELGFTLLRRGGTTVWGPE